MYFESSKIIHTDVYGPFVNATLNGFLLLIISSCLHFLIADKCSGLDVFKIYKSEVDTQHDRKNKIVSSNVGGEYYGGYD